jgi:hypothetical protein
MTQPPRQGQPPQATQPQPTQPPQPTPPPHAPQSYVLGAAAPAPAQVQPAPEAAGRHQAAVAVPLAEGAVVGHAAAQATAAATATVAARPAAAPAAAVPQAAPAAQAPRAGTVYGNRRPFDGEDLPGMSSLLPRLRIGSHLASRQALAQLAVPSAGTGLILGADRDRQQVPVRLFRPEATRTTLVGGVWAAHLVAFRALALGARVVALTVEPGAWQGLGERATGRGDRMGVVAGEQPIVVSGDAQQPILIIYDLGLAGPIAPAPLGPWQTQLVVLRRLEPPGVPAVQECNLALLQRVDGAEAALAGSALRLSPQSVRLLQVLEDDMLALLGGGADRYVWVNQTEIERQYTGPPRR